MKTSTAASPTVVGNLGPKSKVTLNMKIFPKEKIILTTGLSAESVLMTISNSIESERDFKLFHLTKKCKRYEGTVFSESFRINRILTYRNWFIPITFGKVQNNGKGCDINLTIKMEKANSIIFVVWTILLGLVSMCLLVIFIIELFYSGTFVLWELCAPIMFIVGYIYIVSNFKKEMISTKTFLIDLVNAKEE